MWLARLDGDFGALSFFEGARPASEAEHIT